MEDLLEYLKDREYFYKSMAYNDGNLADYYIGKADGIKSVIVHLEKECKSGSYK